MGGGEADDRHPGGQSCLNAGVGVFKNQTVFGRDVQAVRGFEEEFRMGLRVLDLMPIDGREKKAPEAGFIKDEVEVGRFCVGGHGFGYSGMGLEKAADSGYE